MPYRRVRACSFVSFDDGRVEAVAFRNRDCRGALQEYRILQNERGGDFYGGELIVGFAVA